MERLLQFPIRAVTKAERVLVRAIEMARAASPPDSEVSRNELLARLLKVLEGPEALQVYNRVQTY
jgi:hypothetical protein